ncbi:MAG: hypothetical protein B7Y42_00430 [Polaromonas sp. 28-63-22]|jgi:hypothetical protein|nr:MAG: hypothetical protein B7Y42_00430 [Polaromonas sp. 28-63-22]
MKVKFLFVLTLLLGVSGVFAQEAVMGALNAACPGLKTYADQIAMSAPERGLADLTSSRERGWTAVHNVTAKVTDATRGKLAGEYRATGNVCIFSVEAEKMKAVAVSKSACMAICRDKLPAGKPYLAFYGVDGTEQLLR